MAKMRKPRVPCTRTEQKSSHGKRGGHVHKSTRKNNTMAVKNRYGRDGFTLNDVADILLHVEQSSVEEACQYLAELGYADTFYFGSKAYTLEEFYRTLSSDADRYAMAEDVGNLTFQGGPLGKDWYTLNLQCLLEDHVAQSICVYGAEMVARSVGLNLKCRG